MAENSSTNPTAPSPEKSILQSGIDIVQRQAPELAEGQRAAVGVTNDNRGSIVVAGTVDVGHDVEVQGGATKKPGSAWGWFAGLIWKKK